MKTLFALETSAINHSVAFEGAPKVIRLVRRVGFQTAFQALIGIHVGQFRQFLSIDLALIQWLRSPGGGT